MSRIEYRFTGDKALSGAKGALAAISLLGGKVEAILASGEWDYRGAVFQLAGDRVTGEITTRSRRVRVGTIGLKAVEGSVLRIVATFGGDVAADTRHSPIELDDGPVACDCEAVDGPGEGSVEDPYDEPAEARD